jgi:hypothetical protein
VCCKRTLMPCGIKQRVRIQILLYPAANAEAK